MILERPHLSRRLANAARHPITLLAAPAGYGKSVVLDAYQREASGEVLRFNVRRVHGSLARFTRALAAALEPALPLMGQSLAIAHERAVQSPKPSDILADWLAEHLDGPPRTIVIDDLHHCEGDRAIAALLASTIARAGSHVRWILATRSTIDLPLANWLARGDVDLPIDERALRFTPEEARALGLMLAPALDLETIARLRDVTGGTPAIFSFGLATIAQDPQNAQRLLSSGGDPFGRFADHVLARFTPDERSALIESAVFPDVDEMLFERSQERAAWFASIATRAPQIFETRDGRRHFHGLFLYTLRERLKDLGSEAARALTIRAAHALEAAGRTSDAFALYIREREDAELVRLIEAHGFAFLEAGYGESIHEAIDALDPLVQMNSAAVLAIKAMSESSRGRFDTAESLFQLGLGRAPDQLREQIAYQYGTHLLRFFRPEAVDVFEGLANAANLGEKLRAYAFAALGPAYVFEHRMDDAAAATTRALEISRTLGVPHVIAKAHFQAGYVALYAGDAARAKALASMALSVANEHGYFDIAAGALSVLYNVASDLEDDPIESLRLLEAVGDCAAKSGSLINSLISLVASLEIEVERNNEEVAEVIDQKLQTLDVSLAGRTTYEALLPTQAMRASWDADFIGAYRLLENSAEQQWSADRKALRYAEIAAYAAAAGLDREAADALRATAEILKGISVVDLRVQRARLFAALAAIVLGRTESAAEILAKVDASPETLSRRLIALRRTLGALYERYRGERNHNVLLARLAELDECGFAGIARTISMLPLADNASQRATRLSVAERVAARRFADGEEPASDQQLCTIAKKLGSADRRAVLRAVTWHRDVFEGER
jgi:ATP/maltotriose-dependent transcriptional regulator MalT